MALVRNVTEWSHVAAAGAAKSITIPAATAGSRLVLFAAGGAIVTMTGGTKRTTYGGGGMDISVSDLVAAGGETSVAITLNGAENVSGLVYELGPGTAYSAWSGNGAGAVPDAPPTGNYETAPTSAVTAAADGLLVAGWAVAAPSGSRPHNDLNKLRGFGPLGHLYGEGGNQPGSGAEFVWASGLADVDATHSFPVTESAGNYRVTSQFVNPSGSTTAYAVQVLYTDTSGVASVPERNEVAAENTLPGTDSAFWFTGAGGVSATIAGYTDKVSYDPGEVVNFKVDSTGNPFRVELFRLGYYGWESFGARRVAANVTGTIESQPAPSVDGTLGSTSCAWTTNATWTVPADACPGVYYALIRRTDDTSKFCSHHFVVKGSTAGRVVATIPDMTYQAYNAWGAVGDNGSFSTGTVSGRSLYRHGADGATDNFGHRAYAVSWDRPFHTMAGNPNTYLWDADHSWIVFAEAQGYDLTYLSDVDLDVDPTVLEDAALVVLLGHSEYWTAGVYDAYTNTLDAGVNLLCNSSNTALWHTRFASADTARRTMICYKESGTRDVSAGHAGTGYDPNPEWTGTWRDVLAANGKANTDVRRENALTGQLFLVNGAVVDQLRVPFTSKSLPIWRNSASIQALTSGQTFATVKTTMGYEVDIPDGSEGQPDGLVELNPHQVDFDGKGVNAAGTVYTGNTDLLPAGFTLYRRSSGALVFNTGSWRGWWGVNRWYGGDVADIGRSVDLDWQNALLAALYDLGAEPTTLTAMRPGLDAAVTDPATGAPGPARDDVAQAYGIEIPASGGAMLLFFE
ncbi:N,N-dimethylformamidase beta subunit family domain-containing protein [Saccharothrix stipae]